MCKNKNLRVRSYVEDDAPFLSAIYYNTIHIVNVKDYSKEQIDAWAPLTSLDTNSWKEKWVKVRPIVAELNNVVIGFAELEDNGHIDCFYVHHEYQGKGVGSLLLKTIEQKAIASNITRLFAEVSITAKPFFLKNGFVVIKQQLVTIRGVGLTNFIMEKLYDLPKKISPDPA